MNTNDYILSGILEQYVLGDISPQEKKEVECMSHIYPEIQAELTKVQIALEGFAMDNAIEVPSHIKKNIFEQIEKEEVTPIVNIENTTAKVVELNVVKNTSTFNKKYLVAASIALIASVSAVYFLLNSSYNTKQLALNNKIETIEKDKDNLKNQLQNLSVENNKFFVLQGNAKAPGKSMIVVWNNKTGNVYVNNIQLPNTPTNKQYQLWALKDGKPIDLGVFDVNTNLQNMKMVAGAQAFAVTLEQKGGSPTPHLEELYAIINI